MNMLEGQNDLLIYKDKNGNVVVDAIYRDETLWLTQKGMAKVFDVGISAISKHLKNIFEDQELDEKVVVSKMENTTRHGAIESRTQTNEVKIYNLDAIIAVGYRVNSKKATEFRTWATKRKNYMDIRTKFIKDFPIPKGNKDIPYIILFDGYTGMGKSTVAKVIAKKDNSVILNNDQVRDWLNDYHDSTNLKSDLQKYRLELLLKNNNSCICDSCFCHNWKEKIKYYNKLGYKYYIIRLECDESIIKERLLSRVKDNANYSIANFNDYLWMTENVSHVDDNLVDYTINTETNIEEQVNGFINRYNLV